MIKVTMLYNYYSAATCAEVEAKVTNMCVEQVSDNIFKHIDFRGDLIYWSPDSLRGGMNLYVHKIIIENPSQADIDEERRRIGKIVEDLESKTSSLREYMEGLDDVH